MSADRVTATYLIETPHSLERTAEVLAGEQSSGTFVAVPGETIELKQKYGARVERIDELEPASQPSLPGSKLPKAAGSSPVYRRGRVVVSFPLHNFGPSLPSLLSTVAGNLYELQELSGIRLEDIELPDAFAQRYPGPAFGVEGTRRVAGVEGRALIGTIIKPSIGLSIEALRPLVRDLATAGLDFIKDDELSADPLYAPFEQRAVAVLDEIQRVADKTGKRALVRAQHHRRHRPHAAQPRQGARSGRNLRDGQRQRGGYRCRGVSAAALRIADPRPSRHLRRARPRSLAGHRISRLPEALPARRVSIIFTSADSTASFTRPMTR